MGRWRVLDDELIAQIKCLKNRFHTSLEYKSSNISWEFLQLSSNLVEIVISHQKYNSELQTQIRLRLSSLSYMYTEYKNGPSLGKIPLSCKRPIWAPRRNEFVENPHRSLMPKRKQKQSFPMWVTMRCHKVLHSIGTPGKRSIKTCQSFLFQTQVYMPSSVRSAFHISTFRLHKHCIHIHKNIICLAFAEGKICLKKQAITDYWNLGCKLDSLSELLNPFRDERALLTLVKKLLCGPPLDCSLTEDQCFETQWLNHQQVFVAASHLITLIRMVLLFRDGLSAIQASDSVTDASIQTNRRFGLLWPRSVCANQ